MARPLWSDAGTDVTAIADHLDHLAATSSTLRFEPRNLPEVDRALLHRAAILRARRQLAQRHGEKDRILAEEVRAIDDLVRTANLMVERLREWYALHAPETIRLTDPKQLASLVAEHGDRTSVLTALEHADLATASLGSDLEAADLAVVQGFAQALKAVHDSWAAIEKRVGELMEQLAPNVSSVVGPVIGARLIAMSGSLQRLATVPTGTVQLYGAETALFRHIKEGTKPPKHGILFQHPKVHQAPPWQRGAIARTLALHVSLAAKADAFTGNDLRQQIAEDLEKELARIASTKAKPKPRQAHQQGARGGRPGGARFGGGGRPQGKSSGKPYGKPGGKPYGKPGGKPGGKPHGKPGGKPYGKPGSKPQGGPKGGPDRRPGGKKKDKFSGGPARPPGGGR